MLLKNVRSVKFKHGQVFSGLAALYANGGSDTKIRLPPLRVVAYDGRFALRLDVPEDDADTMALLERFDTLISEANKKKRFRACDGSCPAYAPLIKVDEKDATQRYLFARPYDPSSCVDLVAGDVVVLTVKVRIHYHGTARYIDSYSGEDETYGPTMYVCDVKKV